MPMQDAMTAPDTNPGVDTGVDAGTDAFDGSAPSDSGTDATLDAGSEDASDAADVFDGNDGAIPCSDASPCLGPLLGTCCSGVCVNTAKDPSNCGMCGAACTGTQFCTGTACQTALVSNVCGNANGTVV